MLAVRNRLRIVVSIATLLAVCCVALVLVAALYVNSLANRQTVDDGEPDVLDHLVWLETPNGDTLGVGVVLSRDAVVIPVESLNECRDLLLRGVSSGEFAGVEGVYDTSTRHICFVKPDGRVGQSDGMPIGRMTGNFEPFTVNRTAAGGALASSGHEVYTVRFASWSGIGRLAQIRSDFTTGLIGSPIFGEGGMVGLIVSWAGREKSFAAPVDKGQLRRLGVADLVTVEEFIANTKPSVGELIAARGGVGNDAVGWLRDFLAAARSDWSAPEAEELLSRSLDAEPLWVDSLLFRAEIRYRRGDLEGAIADLDAAIGIDRRDNKARGRLAQLKAEAQR